MTTLEIITTRRVFKEDSKFCSSLECKLQDGLEDEEEVDVEELQMQFCTLEASVESFLCFIVSLNRRRSNIECVYNF